MTLPSIAPGLDLTDDRQQNTRMLMEVPGLAETITPQLGSAIFIPHLEGDVGKELQCLNIDIDGRPMQFFKPVNAVTRVNEINCQLVKDFQ